MALDHNLIAGLYPDKEQAQQVLQRLEHEGLRPERLALEEAFEDDRQPGGAERSGSEQAQDAALGAVIGTGAGVSLAGAAAVVAPALFAAAPVLAPLVAAGVGTAIGGTAGAVAGLRLGASEFTQALEEALSEGYNAVLVKASSPGQRELAERIFAETSDERPVRAS